MLKILPRQWLTGLLLLGSLVALGGCAGLGGPRSVTLSEAELNTLLARQFPIDRRVLEVLDVNVSSPRLRLLPERNRLATELDVRAGERLGGRTVRGSLSLDYALRFEPSDASVRLTGVRVNELRLDGVGLPIATQRLSTLIAERLLDDFAIWRASPERAERMRSAGVGAGTVTVTARGVEIVLGPAP